LSVSFEHSDEYEYWRSVEDLKQDFAHGVNYFRVYSGWLISCFDHNSKLTINMLLSLHCLINFNNCSRRLSIRIAAFERLTSSLGDLLRSPKQSMHYRILHYICDIKTKSLSGTESTQLMHSESSLDPQLLQFLDDDDGNNRIYSRPKP
jgi:hypothetical protein